MKILVSGPVNYDYSQYIVQEIQRLGHTVFLYPMKDFYRYCSYLERKAYKLGVSSIKECWPVAKTAKLSQDMVAVGCIGKRRAVKVLLDTLF